MSELTISSDDILDMNIRLAKDLIIEANSTPYKKKKLKSLFMALGIIEKSLVEEGIDINTQLVKKKKEKK